MILKASLSLLDRLKDHIPPSPSNFLEVINQRHLLYILGGFIDAHPTQFNEFDELAEMWIHEVVHTVIDRF